MNFVHVAKGNHLVMPRLGWVEGEVERKQAPCSSWSANWDKLLGQRVADIANRLAIQWLADEQEQPIARTGDVQVVSAWIRRQGAGDEGEVVGEAVLAGGGLRLGVAVEGEVVGRGPELLVEEEPGDGMAGVPGEAGAQEVVVRREVAPPPADDPRASDIPGTQQGEDAGHEVVG
uniref:Uncharacterized protein n=1 Tax=Arundo donax TaxID=35708 RepID=A0A0A9CWJ5_ARUDO